MANVLIVDDELSIQRMLSYLLEQKQHTTFTVSGASEALIHLYQHSVDLILLDIAMPDVDGIALLEQLRNMDQYQTVPIVMLTANTSELVRKEAEKAGASAFLNKLASPDELLGVINDLLAEFAG